MASYVLLDAHASDEACGDAGQRVFETSGGFAPLSGLEPAIDDLRRECHGGAELLNAAEVIRQASVRRPALAPVAVDVARYGTEEEPDNYVAWATLGAAEASIDPEAARASYERAKELNPRLEVPASLQPQPPGRR